MRTGGSIRRRAAVGPGSTEETARADSATEGDETTHAGWGTTSRDYTAPAAGDISDRYVDCDHDELDVGNGVLPENVRCASKKTPFDYIFSKCRTIFLITSLAGSQRKYLYVWYRDFNCTAALPAEWILRSYVQDAMELLLLLLLPFYGHYTGQLALAGTEGFYWSKVLLPTCPCWRQLAHSD